MQVRSLYVLLVVLLVAAAGQVVVSAPASAAPTAAAPTVSPARPYVGSSFSAVGRVPGRFARTVKLQVWDGRTYVTRATKRSTSTGRYALSYTSKNSSTRLRMAFSAGKHSGRKYAAVVSRPKTVALQPNTISITAPATAHERESFTIGVATAPAAEGRRLMLERQSGDTWVSVATTSSGADGCGTFTLTPPRSPARQTYRARVEASGSRPAATSGIAEVAVDPWQAVARLRITTDADPETGTSAPIESNEQYVRGTMALEPLDSGLTAFTLPGRFRVRGNGTSYARVKLSYKVKLDKKSSVAGFPASKDWALLANFYDRSMLRTETAFEAARRIGMPWSPRTRFVEVFVNGNLQGLYQLGENVEKAAERVALPAAGVLLEGDFRDDGDPRFSTSRGLTASLKDPDDGGDELTRSVAAGVQAAEDSLYGDDFADPDTGYRAHVDVPSFVDWYLVNELMKTFDGSFNASIWMSWSEGRVAMAAPWDFDLSGGNRKEFELSDPTGWYLSRDWWVEDVPRPYSMMGGQAQGHWLTQMSKDPWFRQQVRQRWAEVAPALRALPQHVEAQAAEIELAAERNFAPRADGGAGQPIGPTFLDPESVAVYHGTWPAEAVALEEWIAQRVAWMDSRLSDPAP